MQHRYIDKEENLKLLEFCLTTLFNTDHLPLDASDIDDSELTEYNLIPDTVQGAQKVRVCLQESDDFIMPGMKYFGYFNDRLVTNNYLNILTTTYKLIKI